MPKLSERQLYAIERLKDNFLPHSTVYGVVTDSSTRGSGYSQAWQIFAIVNGQIVNCSLYCSNLLKARRTSKGAFWTRSTLQDICEELSDHLGYSLGFTRL